MCFKLKSHIGSQFHDVYEYELVLRVMYMFGFSCNKVRKCPDIPLFYYPLPCISIYINTRVILGNMALLCSGKYLGLGQYYVVIVIGTAYIILPLKYPFLYCKTILLLEKE